MRDSGLVRALLSLEDREAVLSHSGVGNSWEGFVIENILRVASDHVEASISRTSAGEEIDLVLSLPKDELWVVEIKPGLRPTLERGFHNAREDMKPTRAFVVYSGEERYKKKDNVEAISLRGLCLELLALR